MPYAIWWFMLWWVSTFLQLCGLLLAFTLWRRSPGPGWRCFWLAFLGNWVFTLAHQGVGILLAHDGTYVLDMLAWLMKLGAMGCELVVMYIAHERMRAARQAPGLSEKAL
jgi:hypothetical protein